MSPALLPCYRRRRYFWLHKKLLILSHPELFLLTLFPSPALAHDTKHRQFFRATLACPYRYMAC